MNPFYLLVYDATQLPYTGDDAPSIAPVNNCEYFPNGANVELPIVNGVQQSGLCVTTFAELQAFLDANGIMLDQNAMYYQVLDTSH